MSPNRSVLLIGSGILALVVISVLVVLLVRHGPATFPPGSAEAAMAGYLAAWEDDDLQTAYGFFSDPVREQMSLREYLDAAPNYGERGSSHQVTIDRVDGSGDRVTIQLTVEEFYGDGLSADVYRSPRTVRMVREAGGWKVDEPLIWLDPGPFIEEPV